MTILDEEDAPRIEMFISDELVVVGGDVLPAEAVVKLYSYGIGIVRAMDAGMFEGSQNCRRICGTRGKLFSRRSWKK